MAHVVLMARRAQGSRQRHSRLLTVQVLGYPLLQKILPRLAHYIPKLTDEGNTAFKTLSTSVSIAA